MAKRFVASNIAGKKINRDYPSTMGSHTTMINADLTDQLKEDYSDMVVCVDERGPYLTTNKKCKDSCKLMDMNRMMETAARSALVANAVVENTDISEYIKSDS
jgi:hypothetical protein